MAEFDGSRAAMINVSQVEAEDLIHIVEATKETVAAFGGKHYHRASKPRSGSTAGTIWTSVCLC